MTEIKKRFIDLSSDKYINWAVSIFIVIFALNIIILIWKWNSLPSQVPLFYSLPKSPDQLGSPMTLLLLPLSSLLSFIINYSLAVVLYSKEKLASILLVITATTISFLFFITFIRIVFLVT